MAKLSLIEQYQARFLAVAVSAPRQPGRMQSLRRIESRLGELERLARICEVDSYAAQGLADHVWDMVGSLEHALRQLERSPAEVKADQLRAARKARRDANRDLLASRKPGNVSERALLRVAHKLASYLRGSKHGHSIQVTIVPPGQEGAHDSRIALRPSRLGLPKSYAKKGFWVLTSVHALAVSSDLWKVPPSARWDGKHVRLSPHITVRNGRGTSLVVERTS